MKPKERFISKIYPQTSGNFIVNPMRNNFAQIRVHQQFVFNFCGYHMLYNAINLVKFYRGGDQRYLHLIQSCENKTNTSFWRFKHLMGLTLRRWAKAHKKTKDQLWNDSWCLDGDLERSHLIVLLSRDPSVIDSLMDEPDLYHSVISYVHEFKYPNVFAIFHHIRGISNSIFNQILFFYDSNVAKYK